jgi:signal transduction histidine kinase
MSRPILRDGRFAGEIHVSIDPEYMTDFQGDVALGPHGAATMMNMDRRLIIRLPAVGDSEYGKPLNQLMVWAALEKSPSGTFVNPIGLDGIGRMLFYKKLDNYPVVINIGYADRDIDDGLAEARRNLTILGLAWALVTLVVCLLLLRMERKTLSLSLAREASAQQARELEAVNVKLQQSNADLEEFAYVASHDLQSPLRNVTSYAQLLQRRFQGQLGSDGDEFIGFIVGNALRMAALIKDLLDYARVSRQPQTPPAQAVAAEVALRQALDNLAQPITDSGAVVTASALPLVPIDELQLSSLFQNLIGNAIKYRHPDRAPVITVSAETTDTGVWRFAVADNGIGIEPEYLEKIFAIFQRLHTIDQQEGSGIGLALCRRIVNRWGGTIWATSTPGEGTIFFFTLGAPAG